MIENEHVKRKKFKFNLVLEHYNLPFGDHPRDEFGVKLFMVFFSLIIL
jgi:hypothetical protein